MKSMKKHISTGKSAGQKPENPEPSGSSYTLYDTCDKCPLSVYIDLVCNDNLRALVLTGNPPEDVIQEAKMGLLSEFHELSGDARSASVTNSLRLIYGYKAQILGLVLSAQLLPGPDKEQIAGHLRQNGIRIKSIPEDEAGLRSLVQRIESRIKNLQTRLKEEVKRYNAMQSRSAGQAPTPDLFNDQLVLLSKHVGFHLSKTITLAEYAGYLKDYKTSIKYGRNDK